LAEFDESSIAEQTSINFVHDFTDSHPQALVDVAWKLDFVVDDQVAFLMDVVRAR
jgi:hypothetical protein